MRALILVAAAVWLLAGCSGFRRGADLEACEADHRAPKGSRLPACVDTDEGAISIEEAYLPGVVDCELGGVTTNPAALEAQAIAARTYLARHLSLKGNQAKVDVTPRFQCYRPAKRPESYLAAANTAGVVLLYQGKLQRAHYVSGARVDKESCDAKPPAHYGYDYKSWSALTKAFLEARKAGRRLKLAGTAWTELYVTRNEGLEGKSVKSTPMAPKDATNRGALGQWATACLARQGYQTRELLEFFYGADLSLSSDGAPIKRPDKPRKPRKAGMYDSGEEPDEAPAPEEAPEEPQEAPEEAPDEPIQEPVDEDQPEGVSPADEEDLPELVIPEAP